MDNGHQKRQRTDTTSISDRDDSRQLRPRGAAVLLDAKLGDLDGSEVCRRTLAVSPTTAVVILTGYVQDGAVLNRRRGAHE
jgi:DNA-binding response OmpR family regulator